MVGVCDNDSSSGKLPQGIINCFPCSHSIRRSSQFIPGTASLDKSNRAETKEDEEEEVANNLRSDYCSVTQGGLWKGRGWSDRK